MNIPMKKLLVFPLLLLWFILTPCAFAISSNSTVGQYGMLPVYGFDIEDGAYTVTVESDCTLLQNVLADITIADGTITAELMPDNTNLSALSMESGEKTAENSIEANADGIFTISVKALDTKSHFLSMTRRRSNGRIVQSYSAQIACHRKPCTLIYRITT